MILHPPYSTPSAACPKNAMNGAATFNDFQGQFFTEVRIDSILRFSARCLRCFGLSSIHPGKKTVGVMFIKHASKSSENYIEVPYPISSSGKISHSKHYPFLGKASLKVQVCFQNHSSQMLKKLRLDQNLGTFRNYYLDWAFGFKLIGGGNTFRYFFSPLACNTCIENLYLQISEKIQLLYYLYWKNNHHFQDSFYDHVQDSNSNIIHPGFCLPP